MAEIGVVQAERDIYDQLKKAMLDFDAGRKQYEVSQKGVTSATEVYNYITAKKNLEFIIGERAY